ncbi:MAG TPA: S8 family serine peptidase [Flavobacteriales bacterium]|nr:S8 family serine peptidase [Flavobacteriales bacterium]
MRVFLSVALSLFLLRPAAQAQAVAIPGDLLIMLAPGADAEKVADDLATINGQPTGMQVVRLVSRPMRTWLLRFDPSRAAQFEMLRAARSHKGVRLAQNNHHLELREIPNDSDYGDQWHHQNINSEGAWDISTGGLTADGDTIVVCIIENSDLPHPDLIANAWYNHQEIPNNDVDDDLNGYVDDFRGWNPNSETDQVYGGSHGTQVAGMIGATGNNELGVVGANWAVKMMVVFNSGANDAGVLASHSYPLTMRRLYNETNGTNGAFVVATNASWGINGGQPADAPIWCAMYDSLGAEGVLNCGATANNAVDVDEVGDLPTACPSDFMISVTATDINDERTFSAYGLTTIDVGAPGDDVYTTNINGGYGTTSGTSFASPLTAGVVGLLYSAPCASMMTLVKADPEQGALYIRDMLFDGVDQVGNLPGQTVTGGRINAATACSSS